MAQNHASVCSRSREDGISWEEEVLLRRKGVEFINEAGTKLRFKQPTVGLACVYFHRFYVVKSFAKYDMQKMACASLFLAGKRDEAPRRVRDIVNVWHNIECPNTPPLDNDEQYFARRKAVLTHEWYLLGALSFKTDIRDPYKYLLCYARALQLPPMLTQFAINFLNDSYRTVVCLHHEPARIACAMLFLVSRICSESWPLSDSSRWWEVFSGDVTELTDVCDQVLNLYENADHIRGDAST